MCVHILFYVCAYKDLTVSNTAHICMFGSRIHKFGKFPINYGFIMQVIPLRENKFLMHHLRQNCLATRQNHLAIKLGMALMHLRFKRL